MLEQIQEVVRKNLPAEVGDQLKQYMRDAETWSSEVKRLTREKEDQAKRIAERDSLIVELQGKLKAAGDLDKREREVTGRENVQDVTRAEMRAQAAQDRCQAVFDLASLAFRSPRIMRSTHESESVPVILNGYTQQATKSKTTDETTEQQ